MPSWPAARWPTGQDIREQQRHRNARDGRVPGLRHESDDGSTKMVRERSFGASMCTSFVLRHGSCIYRPVSALLPCCGQRLKAITRIGFGQMPLLLCNHKYLMAIVRWFRPFRIGREVCDDLVARLKCYNIINKRLQAHSFSETPFLNSTVGHLSLVNVPNINILYECILEKDQQLFHSPWGPDNRSNFKLLLFKQDSFKQQPVRPIVFCNEDLLSIVIS